MLLIKQLVRPNILKLKPYSSARAEFKGKAAVFLDANENPFENGNNRYPDPQQSALKVMLKKEKGIPPEKMLLGNGSDEVLDLLIRAFCEPGKDNIIITPPTYGMYKVIADINNVPYKEAFLEEDFSLNTDKILALKDEHTKMLFLCSPNNPTGNIMDMEKVEFLLKEINCIVVIDEAYIDFSEAESWSTKLAAYPNLVVCQTLSKAWGLAGIRLGMCFASEFIITILNKIKPPYNVNTLSQETAMQFLNKKADYLKKLDSVLVEKNKLKDKLQQLSFVEKVYPSAANFFLIKTKDSKIIYDFLVGKGIIIRDRSTQPGCENCLRISIGTTAQNEQLLNALQEVESLFLVKEI